MSQNVDYHTFLSIVLKNSIHLYTHSFYLVINLQVFLSPANTVLPFVLFGKMLKVCKIWLLLRSHPFILWYSSNPSLQMRVTHHALRNFEDNSRVGGLCNMRNTLLVND